MKVIVIGGTGCIGKPLVDQLLQANHEVTCYNRSKNAVQFNGNVTIINGDRFNYAEFEATMKPLRFDVVIDMVAFTAEDAASTLRAFGDTVSQYIFTSSAAAYNRPVRTLPISVDEPLLGDDYADFFPYGYKKAKMELMLREKMILGKPITIIRPSLTYGVGKKGVGLMRNNYGICSRIIQGKPVVVCGDGTTPYTFTFASDLVRAYVGAVGNPLTLRQYYHATSEEVTTWDDFYIEFGKIVGVEPKIIHIPSELVDAASPVGRNLLQEKMHCGIYDNSKIKAHVSSFKCTQTLSTGLRTIYDWYMSDPALQIVNEELDSFEDELCALYYEWYRSAAALRK